MVTSLTANNIQALVDLLTAADPWSRELRHITPFAGVLSPEERAVGAVLGVHEVLVIGSQALHPSVPGDVPDKATRSVEADIAARNRGH